MARKPSIIKQANEVKPSPAIVTIRAQSLFQKGFLKGKSFNYACVHHPDYVRWLWRHKVYNFSGCAQHAIRQYEVSLQCVNVS